MPRDPLGSARRQGRLLAASFALLGVLQWVVSFWATRTIRTVATYDTAYYYVVARNVARGQGLLDTVIWHLLGTPETVARPAGDYWEVGWPVVLGALLRVFGDSQRAAIFLCAALSGLLPLLTALVAWLATRRATVAWTAGLLVVLQARLWATDASPDVTLPYQLTVLGALAAFHVARDRDLGARALVAVGAALVLPAYVRGEGFVVAACALPLLLFTGAPGDGAAGGPVVTRAPAIRERARRLVPVLLGMALVIVPFTLRNLLAFGHLLPTGRSLRFWMKSINDLDRFATDPTPAKWWAQGWERLLDIRFRTITLHLAQLTEQIPWPLVLFAVIGAVALLRAERRRAAMLPSLFLASLLVPCLMVPVIANPDRFVMNMVPVLAIFAAVGAFAVAERARRSVDRRAVTVAVVGAAVAASSLLFRGEGSVPALVGILRIYRDTPPELADAAVLAPLGLERGDVVLTDDPLRAAATLDIAAITSPLDGFDSLEAAVEKYRPRFVLARTPALERLATRGRFPFRAVSSVKGVTWYELQEGVRNADGSLRRGP